MPTDERRDWSLITVDEFDRYTTSALEIVAYVKREGIHPFAAALAGVAFIRGALEGMGGRVEWWLEFVRTGKLPEGPAGGSA